MKFSKIEFLVGCFMLAGIFAGVMLALKVAGLSFSSQGDSYAVYASFDNIGSLKVRAPVKIGGVVIGRVSNISIDVKNFTPKVEMQIESRYNQLSDTSTAAIRTSGLLGEQYIAITPGFSDADMGTAMLKNGDSITDTKSALVLEDLIGKFVYGQANGKSAEPTSAAKSTNH
ncbi:outer membrane lipid asymmetry maintenance protein MlaD [Tolumonas lignilytica]|jgi:ABC-type transport system involved in resistance to organic solvents, periplasmic component|uniref:outer membrane lipid asymmetry maintenance protein MlaD n=1 Tax=Tolumonas lignilytica TaxID=1283284 RepID=UPI00046456BB|nr:outer membrane lipid asymmetry maintenance protein MlaD [Tolumonas lignilytica]